MKITGTCQITIEGDNHHPITPYTLERMAQSLSLIFSEHADEIVASYGIDNVELYPCKVGDLKIQPDQTQQP